MPAYLLDFTATPLKPAAGGQLHRVYLPDDEDTDLEEAIVDIVKKYGLVGETDTFVPVAKVQYTLLGDSYDVSVQVEPASAAPDYDPDPVKPTAAEVLAAFPNATDIRVCAGTGFRRFNLALAAYAYQLAPRDDGQCLVITLYDGLRTGQFITNDWVDGVRQNVRRNIEALGASAKKNALAAAALAAALGDAQ